MAIHNWGCRCERRRESADWCNSTGLTLIVSLGRHGPSRACSLDSPACCWLRFMDNCSRRTTSAHGAALRRPHGGLAVDARSPLSPRSLWCGRIGVPGLSAVGGSIFYTAVLPSLPFIVLVAALLVVLDCEVSIRAQTRWFRSIRHRHLRWPTSGPPKSTGSSRFSGTPSWSLHHFDADVDAHLGERVQFQVWPFPHLHFHHPDHGMAGQLSARAGCRLPGLARSRGGSWPITWV